MYKKIPKTTLNLTKGFTLIELIIVMAVIGALGSIMIMNFPAGRERARDTNRRADLKQYQTAMETAANRNNGIYPIDETGTDPSTFCVVGGDLEKYENCPQDPRNGDSGECSGQDCEYHYMSNAVGTQYSLWAALERPADNLDFWFVVCSNGLTKESATAPTAANLCP